MVKQNNKNKNKNKKSTIGKRNKKNRNKNFTKKRSPSVQSTYSFSNIGENQVLEYNVEDRPDEDFTFIQHNVGCVDVKFKTLHFDKYGQPVKYKRQQVQVRDFASYMKKTNYYADLFTFQEIQENKELKKVKVNNDKFKIVYRKTGAAHYYTYFNKTREYKVEEVNHGCAVAFNTEKFKLVDTYEKYLIPEKEGYLPRSTPFVILENRDTNSIFAVLSLHGLIFDPASSARLKRAEYFFRNVKKAIKEVLKEYRPDYIIIGTDLNTDINRPRLNAFEDKSPEYMKDLKMNGPIFKDLVRDFKQFLTDNNIGTSIDQKIRTNYNYDENKELSFYEKIDFVLHTSKLKNDGWNLNCQQYMGTKPKKSSDLNFLKNDFDHLNIEIDFN